MNPINLYSNFYIEFTVLYMLLRKTKGEKPGCNSLIGPLLFTIPHCFLFIIWIQIFNDLTFNIKDFYIYTKYLPILLAISILLYVILIEFKKDKLRILLKKYLKEDFEKIIKKKIFFHFTLIFILGILTVFLKDIN